MRTINTDPQQQKVIESFVNLFGVTVSVDDLCNEGIVLKDQAGRKVAPAHADQRGDMFHTGKPYADIMVIGVGGILVGWCHATSMVDVGDRFLVPVKALYPLPKTFNFVQPCAHLSVHGGVSRTPTTWECLGCSIEIVMQ